MPRQSSGILLFRRGAARDEASLEVLLVHPGGPLWARKDLGAWSIPKGEIDDGEDPLAAARREFAEELGSPPLPDDTAPPITLGEVRLKSGKRITGWACEGDLDVDTIVSNTFEMQWPPRSGRMQAFPEVDRAEWFSASEARERLNPAQAAFVDRLLSSLDAT